MATNENENSTLGEKVYQILLERILSLEYPPETVLVEKELCAELKVSRPPLKGAIVRLEEMNLVKTVPRFGTVVNRIDVNEISHIYEVKLDLESLACSLAAQRITEAEIRELERLTALLEEVARKHELLKSDADMIESHKQITKLDIAIHGAIWAATHNPVLEKILSNLHSRCLRFCRATIPLSGWNIDHIDHFHKINEAMRRGDRDKAVEQIRFHNRQYIKVIRDIAFNPGS